MPTSAAAKVMDLVNGCWTTQTLSAAVKLGIIDALASSPRSAVQLSRCMHADARSTARLLGALAALDLCTRRLCRSDPTMLIGPGGQERTLSEFEDLLREAGLELRVREAVVNGVWLLGACAS